MRKIGAFSQEVILALGLSIKENTPIYVGDSNIDHMRRKHPVEFDLYFPHIEEIINNPDYVGKNEKNGSIDFVKVFAYGSDHVQVSVRVNKSGTYFARTLFLMMSYKAKRYISRGNLVKLTSVKP